MPPKKKTYRRLYTQDRKKDSKVGAGKYSAKRLTWVAKHDPEYFKQIERLYYKKYSFAKKALYDDITKNFFKNIDLYVDQKQNIVEFVINHRKESYNFSIIKSLLQEQYKEISEVFLTECFEEAKDTIKKEYEIEKDFIVDIHILRYDELFDKACNPDLSRVPLPYHNSIRAENYINAVEILAQKERVLGIHTKNFKIQINNYLQLKQRKDKKTINFDILSLNEQIELLRLIELTQVSDINQSIIQSSLSTEVVRASIIQKTIEAPIRQSKQTDVITDEENKEVKEKGRSLLDLKEAMKETLRKQIEEAYRKGQNKK